MPVYIRTAAGRAAALNPLSPLPRSLRTLLTVIDGQSDSTVYVDRLPSLGNVQALLDFLEQNGFIQIAYQRPAETANRLGGNAPGAVQPVAAIDAVPWSDTHAGDLEPLASTPGPGGSTASATHVERPIAAATIDELSSIATAQKRLVPEPVPPAPAVIAPSLVPNNSTANSSQYKLRSAVLMISDFVTLHMPGESIEIILTVEGLETTEQLMNSLPGYAALIAPLGQPANEHIAQLNATLI